MSTVGTAYVQIVPSAKGIGGSISSMLSGEATSAGTAAGGSIAGAIKGVLLKAGIGIAITKGIKASMSEGAALQQSYLGGLDTLYGEAAEAARNYAREAAAAGISMNSYSEQAVSFGAALKNAYGGDTYKAMEAANTAILDMADNSAKMGTDIESVQMAYQGFAKQNYTMLDNLKLGYGGTKTEMQRLLEDAEKLTGVKYDINNLGDVYDAIHVIQGDLGLTGVAADEAATTFSGSLNAMKASAQNFFGSLALGENVSASLSQLMTSASTFFFGNFIPMLGTIIKSLPGAIWTFMSQGVPMLLSNLLKLVTSVASSVQSLASNISGAKVAAWASTMIPKILSAAASVVGKFALGLLKNLPKIVIAVGKIGLAIVRGLGSALWGKVTAAANGIKERFLRPIENLRDRVRGIINKIKGFFKFRVGHPHIPLPHFAISPAGWRLGDLLKGVRPSLSVRWYAKGGIFDEPTIAGIGERGPEAVVPLNKLWDKLDNMQSGETNITININGANKDPKAIADEVKRMLVRETNGRRLAWQ